MTCGDSHPEQAGVICSKEEPCWGFHTDDDSGLVWPGREFPKRQSVEETKGKEKITLTEIAERMR